MVAFKIAGRNVREMLQYVKVNLRRSDGYSLPYRSSSNIEFKSELASPKYAVEILKRKELRGVVSSVCPQLLTDTKPALFRRSDNVRIGNEEKTSYEIKKERGLRRSLGNLTGDSMTIEKILRLAHVRIPKTIYVSLDAVQWLWKNTDAEGRWVILLELPPKLKNRFFDSLPHECLKDIGYDVEPESNYNDGCYRAEMVRGLSGDRMAEWFKVILNSEGSDGVFDFALFLKKSDYQTLLRSGSLTSRQIATLQRQWEEAHRRV